MATVPQKNDHGISKKRFFMFKYLLYKNSDDLVTVTKGLLAKNKFLIIIFWLLLDIIRYILAGTIIDVVSLTGGAYTILEDENGTNV